MAEFRLSILTNLLKRLKVGGVDKVCHVDINVDSEEPTTNYCNSHWLSSDDDYYPIVLVPLPCSSS